MIYKKKFINNLLNIAWLTILLVVGLHIYENFNSVLGSIDEINYSFIIIGIISGILFSMPSAWILLDYFDRFNIRNCWPVAVFLVFVPALGKYIPGKIWAVGSFVLYGKSVANISAENCLVFQIYFQILSILSTIMLLFAAYILGQNSIYSLRFLFVTVLIIIALLVMLILLKNKIRKTGLKIRAYKTIKHLLAFSVQKILRGLSLIIFISAFIEIGDHWVEVLFSFIAAMQIGVLAFFAPAGLGVAEGVYLFVLSPVLGPEIAILIAILFRIWLTMLDFMLALTGLVLKKYSLGKDIKAG